MTQTFLVFFGFLMIMLDFPVTHSSECVARCRRMMYRSLLFMTRFTGRGIWYIFLSTMTFSGLWDLGVSRVLGVVLALPVMVIGVVSTYAGWNLSRKLDQVRLSQDENVELACPPNSTGLSAVIFCETCSHIGVYFDKSELEHVMDALSESPASEKVTYEQYQNWLSKGYMLIV